MPPAGRTCREQEKTNGELTAMRNLKIVTSPQETAPMQEVRVEELRILEAMLFASAEPLDEKTLAARAATAICLARGQPGADQWKVDLSHRRRSRVALEQGNN